MMPDFLDNITYDKIEMTCAEMFPVMNIKTRSLGHKYETVRLVHRSSGRDHKGKSSTLLNHSVTAASVDIMRFIYPDN